MYFGISWLLLKYSLLFYSNIMNFFYNLFINIRSEKMIFQFNVIILCPRTGSNSPLFIWLFHAYSFNSFKVTSHCNITTNIMSFLFDFLPFQNIYHIRWRKIIFKHIFTAVCAMGYQRLFKKKCYQEFVLVWKCFHFHFGFLKFLELHFSSELSSRLGEKQ